MDGRLTRSVIPVQMLVYLLKWALMHFSLLDLIIRIGQDVNQKKRWSLYGDLLTKLLGKQRKF
jgi:hypothetical protein